MARGLNPAEIQGLLLSDHPSVRKPMPVRRGLSFAFLEAWLAECPAENTVFIKSNAVTFQTSGSETGNGMVGGGRAAPEPKWTPNH